MGLEFIYPEFEVVRDETRCTHCRICEQQCANEVHYFDEEKSMMKCDDTNCVNCQRCVSLCPTRALKIVKTNCTLRENANWQNDVIKKFTNKQIAEVFFCPPWVIQSHFLFFGTIYL